MLLPKPKHFCRRVREMGERKGAEESERERREVRWRGADWRRGDGEGRAGRG